MKNNGEVIVKLQTLVKDNPENTFYRSVLDYHNERGFISANQIDCIEKDFEKYYEFEPDPDCEEYLSCKDCKSFEDCPIYMDKSDGVDYDAVKEMTDPEIERLGGRIQDFTSEKYSKVYKKRYVDRQLKKFNWKIKKRLRELGEDEWF